MVQNVDEDRSYEERVKSGDTDAIHDGGYKNELPPSRLQYRFKPMKSVPKSSPKGGGK